MNNEIFSPTPSKHALLRTVIFALMIACFTVYLAFPSAIFAYADLVLFLICAYKISNSKSIFVGIFAVCGILFCFMPITLLAAAVCIVSSAAGGAVLCGNKKTVAIYPAMTAVIFALCLLITSSPESSVAVLAPLPAGIVLALCAKKRVPRVTAICAVSAALLVTAAIPFGISAYSEYGTDLTALIDSLRNSFTNTFIEFFQQLADTAGIELDEIIAVSSLTEMTELIFPLIPSVIVTVANLIAFAVTFLHSVIRGSLGEAPQRRESVFRLSSASAWLYIISLASLLFGFGSSHAAQVFALTMGNFNVILTPAFALVGVAAFIAARKRSSTGRGIFRIILIVIAFMYCGILILYPIALFGVITTLKLNRRGAVR